MTVTAAPITSEPITSEPITSGPIAAAPNLAAPRDTALAHLSEIGPVDVPQTTTVAGYVITLTVEAWAAFAKSMVDATREMLDGFAAEFKRVFGLTLDHYQYSYLTLGDAVAFV